MGKKMIVFLLAFSSWMCLQAEEATRPAILLCSPQGAGYGWIDLQYLRERHEKGFEVDYTEKLSDLTWDRIRSYNCLLLYASPDGWEVGFRGTESVKQRRDEFVAVIERYVAAGGGVLLMPTEHNIRKQLLYDLTNLFGAKLPVEAIIESDPDKKGALSHGAYTVPLAYTDQILESPVSDGVEGVWYPIRRAYNAQQTGPIHVDENWTVVVRGSKTSKTEPIDLSKSNVRELLDPFVRPGGVKAPSLFAIRSYKKGRVALVNQWRQFSVGSGTKWIYNREVLSKGIRGKRSDYGRLLENTYRWLAAPSLQTGAVGGFKTGEETLVPPNRRASARKDFKYIYWFWEYEKAQWHRPPKYAPVFRGLIGAKTAYSSGKGTVHDYAAAAKEAGLDFIVFLEDFERLSKAEYERLVEDCRRESDEKIMLYPGYTIRTNLGDHLFICGPKSSLPPNYCLTGKDKKLFDLQPQDDKGNYTGLNGPSFNWLLGRSNKYEQVGYYNFAGRGSGQKMTDLRVYSVVGLRYYRGGKLVEDMTEDYLRTAQGTLAPSPASINDVYSPEELKEEVKRGNSLTYAQARNLASAFESALRWAHQYDGINVFPSNGPIIHAWPFCHRTITLGSENFTTFPAIMPSNILVTAEKGLKEIRIYNGQALYRRFVLNGEKRFEKGLVLEGIVHKNLVLIAADRGGGVAVSSTRRCWKAGGRQVVFCGDHVNDCKSGGFLLGRGPNAMLAHWVVPLSPDIGGYTWDGGPPANLPLVTFQESRPILETDKGTERGNRFNQTPLSEFSDDGAVAVTSEQKAVFDKSVLRVVNPWHTFGPVGGPSKLMEFTLRYREYHSPTVGVPETGWQGPGVRSGINACLFRSEIKFKDSFKIKSLRLLYNYHRPTVPCGVVIGRAGGILDRYFEPGEPARAEEIRLEPGDWFAFFSPLVSASHIFVNRLQPVKLRIPGRGDAAIGVFAALDGKQVAKGDTYNWELFSLGIPVNRNVEEVEDILKLMEYLLNPTGMKIIRGRRLASPGIIDCEPENYAVEVSIPKPKEKTDLALPLRVVGLNPRWTTGLFQKKGYVKGDHGKGENRYRPLGLDVYGNAYVPLYVDLAPETHVIAGHPVTADEDGKELFIQVTHVYEDPHQWVVAVNNPTDKTITTTLKKAIDLPNLVLPAAPLTLKLGEHRVLR